MFFREKYIYFSGSLIPAEWARPLRLIVAKATPAKGGQAMGRRTYILVLVLLILENEKPPNQLLEKVEKTRVKKCLIRKIKREVFHLL